jgi:hypothetical protein
MIVVLLSLAALAGLALLLLGWRDVSAAPDWLPRANDWAKLVQAVFTLGALLLAAYWYFVERRGLPHADVSQTVYAVPMGAGLVAIEVHISVKNLGERVLRIERIKSRLQRVEARTYGYDKLAGQSGKQYWEAIRPGASKGRQFYETELRWPVHEQYEGPVHHVVEPGETDLIVVTFLYPCSEAKEVRLASDILSPDAKDDEGLAWKARTFTDLAHACDQ